jgi:uncharacterized protein involved in exopolysaccharide biosynthesis
MPSTQTSTVTETKTLVITLAVGGAFAIAAAFIFGWNSLDRSRATVADTSPSLLPNIVEISRH